MFQHFLKIFHYIFFNREAYAHPAPLKLPMFFTIQYIHTFLKELLHIGKKNSDVSYIKSHARYVHVCMYVHSYVTD